MMQRNKIMSAIQRGEVRPLKIKARPSWARRHTGEVPLRCTKKVAQGAQANVAQIPNRKTTISRVARAIL